MICKVILLDLTITFLYIKYFMVKIELFTYLKVHVKKIKFS